MLLYFSKIDTIFGRITTNHSRIWKSDTMAEFTSQLDPSWSTKNYSGILSYIPSKGSVPSDVVPGKYEGGFQLWECTVDLLKYMKNTEFKNKKVFEMGCGRGLPGIYAALNGASEVVLQDYNRDVIEKLTIPNAQLNKCPEDVIKFSASAWRDVSSLFSEKSYEIVLASETIYRKEQIPEFVEAINYLLSNDGVAIIAAKRLYFGLSGSVFDLIDQIKGQFTHELIPVNDPSSNVKRDIIVLKRAN